MGVPAPLMPGFDRLATLYEPLERLSFAWRLQEARRFCLPYLQSCRRGLLIGDGDGRFSAELLQGNSAIQVDSIDISPRMLELAQKRAGDHKARLSAHVSDALKFSYPTLGYDFIGLHFSLDCFSQEQIDSLLPRLEASLQNGGLIAYSDFQARQAWQAALVRVLYLCFRLGAGLRARKLPQARWSSCFKPIAETTVLRGLVFSRVMKKT